MVKLLAFLYQLVQQIHLLSIHAWQMRSNYSNNFFVACLEHYSIVLNPERDIVHFE